MHCKLKTLFSILFASLFFIACDSSNTTAETEVTPETARTTNLPSDLYNRLVNETEQIDFIFHELPISLNFYEKKSILQMLNFLDRATEIQHKNCKPQALVIFTSSTDAIAKAELFFEDNCTYFGFYNEDFKQYQYIVPINGKGLDYFSKVMSTARSNN